MSMYRMPVVVSKLAEKMMRQLLWARLGSEVLISLVKWDQVIAPKTFRGLGIGNLLVQNKALVSKWLWRFDNEEQAYWAQVIKSIYGVSTNGWDSGLANEVTYRAPWKFIWSCREEFEKGLRHKVGNIRKISFWADVWNEENSLRETFEDLYELSRQ
ncbi:hypothetical protein Syun_013757 [Stephania yunnanensis]|uniref:Uncharacterized protein n=1 Tax=Stephania yunnanensis TaxID=152371 RepID=A0AAP0JI70_9MAGN